MSNPNPGPTIPEHVFVSFSQEDRAFAETIVRTLRDKDILAWIDYAQLVPGTADWETAIREAIDKSFAVVVLASPRSRASKYVRGELTLAESKGRDIYPFWIDGADWSDCIPLGMTYAQFIDARLEKREQGIAELCAVLDQHIRSVTPKHYLVSPIRRLVAKERGGSLTRLSPPPGFISLDLEHEDEWEEGGSAVFMRISDYSCVHEFLDDLYIHYLTERFKPFTYGSSWVLQELTHLTSRLLLPWSWLLKRHSSAEIESEWLLRTPLSDCGLAPKTFWCIRTLMESEATGLAINDERIFRAMRRSPKAEYFLRGKGVLEDRLIDEVSSDYRFRFVISRQPFFASESPAGTAMVQTEKNLPEDLINYWGC